MFFCIFFFFFHMGAGKSGGVVAEKARDTGVVFAPDGGPRAMREQSVRCVRLRFFFFACISFSLVFVFLDIEIDQYDIATFLLTTTFKERKERRRCGGRRNSRSIASITKDRKFEYRCVTRAGCCGNADGFASCRCVYRKEDDKHKKEGEARRTPEMWIGCEYCENFSHFECEKNIEDAETILGMVCARVPECRMKVVLACAGEEGGSCRFFGVKISGLRKR